MPAKKSQIQLDYEASFTPSTAAAAIALLNLALVSLGTALSMPWWVPLLIGGAAAGLNLAVTTGHLAQGNPHRVTAALTGIWASWAALTALTLWSQPARWDSSTWWLAISGFAIAWVLTHATLDLADVRDEAAFAENLDNPHANRLSRLEYDRRRHQLASEWIDRIHRATRVRPTVTGLKEWDADTGFSLDLELPTGTRSDAFDTGACRQMAEDARLPIGCTVTPAPSDVQGHLVLHVMLKDPATTSTPYPTPYSRISVLGGVPWMRTPTGEDITVQLREACALIVGPPGTGKTTLLDSILASFARCDDVIVWGIDLGKEGDAFVHWAHDLTPGVHRGVDAVAAYRHQAEAMLDAADAAAKTRLREYRDLMLRHNTKLLPISHEIPMIFIVIDEGVNILSSMDPADRPLKEKIMRVMEETRAMGIRLILTATDGNVSAIGDSRIRKYASVKVALTSTDREGASVSKLFGTVRGIDARQLRAPGSGVIDAGYGPVQARTFASTPSLAKDVTAATTTYRPVLDEPTCKAIAPWYDQRWSHDNTRWIHGELTEGTRPRNTIPTDDDTEDDAQTGHETGKGLTLNLKVRNPDGTTERRSYPTDDPESDDTDARFADIIESMQVADPRPGHRPGLWERADQLKNEWRTAALETLANDPDAWWSTSELLAELKDQGVTVARQTLATELADLARRDIIRTNGSGGAHTRYAGKTNP